MHTLRNKLFTMRQRVCLLKIATYLPVDGLRQISLTCRRLGIGCDDSLSLIEETARRVVQDIATEEEMAALPAYDRDNWLCKYNVHVTFNDGLGDNTSVRFNDGLQTIRAKRFINCSSIESLRYHLL